jgi:Cobalamin-independent synthase, Catalytic domain
VAENSADQGNSFPWQPGTATGIGSLPGTDPLAAARTVITELPDFPHLAELPARGPGADMIGRTAGLLVDIAVETTPRGWRLSSDRPGKDLRRARSMLSQDLDALEEVLDGYNGLLKVQVVGPWTLAATMEQTHSLKPALADPGAVADLTASLAEGLAAHAAEVAKRVPGARLVVQVDEPALPAAIEGRVPTPSGLSLVRAVDEEIIRARLRTVLAAVAPPSEALPGHALPGHARPGQALSSEAPPSEAIPLAVPPPGEAAPRPSASRYYTVVHCCGWPVPFGIVRGVGADGVSFDLSQLRRGDWDILAETAEAGLGLLVGVPSAAPDSERAVSARGASPVPRAPADGPASATPERLARSVADVWRHMGLPPGTCAPQVVITPACGLAGASPAEAEAALRRAREAARILPEIMEEQRS